MNKYYWNFHHDAEVWHNGAESVEKCLEEAKKESGGDYEVVYVAESVPFTIGGRVDVDILLEALEDQAFDFAGEAAEDWMPSRDVKYDKKEELADKIATLLDEWFEENGCAPTFAQLVNTTAYSLREEEPHE